MATARQLVSLLSSLNKGDKEQFFAIALQVAAAEAQRGRKSVADELRVLVEEGRNQNSSPRSPQLLSDSVVPIDKLRGELQTLLVASLPQSRLSDLVLPNEMRDHLDGLVDQQRHRDELRHHNLVPATTVLLVGPPGTGKTLSASALAGELHLPLYVVRFDSVITRYMGETASKLRLIFDHIASRRGVYLFDEFDAIGGKRNADNDIGEMRRVLNSFLQFLEEPRNTDSLILCATNHPELLDRALFRRFNEVLEYGFPSDTLVLDLLTSRLRDYSFSEEWWPSLKEAANGLSHAEVIGAANDTMKQVIMSGKTKATLPVILKNLQRRKTMQQTLLKFED